MRSFYRHVKDRKIKITIFISEFLISKKVKEVFSEKRNQLIKEILNKEKL